MTVYPGVLVSEKKDFDSRIAQFNGKVDGIHIDIADGIFVTNKTLSIDEIGKLPDGFFEAHLMVADPVAYVSVCHDLGFSRVLAHIDSFPDSNYEYALELQEFVHMKDMQFGIVFQRGIQIEHSEHLSKFDHAMVMTIDLGFSGQPFQEDQLTQIARLRSFCPDLSIAADGHVDTITSPRIIESGATHLVSTSFLSGDHALDRYNELKGLS
jgi:pentose-5-phosphate-3-epimerase